MQDSRATTMRQGPFVHKFKTLRNYYIYDLNTNNIVRTDQIVYDLMDDYGILSFSAITQKWAKKYDPREIRHSLTRIRQSCKWEGLFSSSRPTSMKHPMCERHLLESLQGKLGNLILNVTERCNLRCKYCTYSGLYQYERRHSARDMPWEVARAAVDYFHSRSQASNKVHISFFGGEPLLNFGLIKKVVEYTRVLANWPPLTFHIDTNGTLLTKEVMRFLIDNDIMLQLSLDGPPDVHNRYRVFENGLGSFYLVAKNLETLRNMDSHYYQRSVAFAATLAPPYDLLDTCRFYSSNELVAAMNLNVSFVNPYDTSFFKTSCHKVNKTLLTQHLTILRSQYMDFRVASSNGQVNQFLSGLFQGPLVTIHRRELNRMGAQCPPNGICIPGVRRLFVDVEGKIYPCERVGRAFSIGNVSTGIERPKLDSLLETYIANSAEDCTNCWAVRLCGLCLAGARKGNTMDFERKKEHCVGERSWLHDGLVLYAEIMERNPKAFDFVKDMVFE